MGARLRNQMATNRKGFIYFRLACCAENPNRSLISSNYRSQKIKLLATRCSFGRPFLIFVDFPGEAAIEKS
jgi:hypothetical protein